MLPKYTIEYAARVREHSSVNYYGTDDPVACEGFLKELLERGFRVIGIKHEGIDLPRNEFDRLSKQPQAWAQPNESAHRWGSNPRRKNIVSGLVSSDERAVGAPPGWRKLFQ